MVGTAGREPATAGPPDRSSTKPSHVPIRTPGAIRTRILLVRSQALHPLSYRGMVSPGGLEPPTSSLSERCSNQLSYSDMAEGPGFEPGDPQRASALAGPRL